MYTLASDESGEVQILDLHLLVLQFLHQSVGVDFEEIHDIPPHSYWSLGGIQTTHCDFVHVEG